MKKTQNQKINKELKQALSMLKKQIKNTRESSRVYTAGIIWSFLCDKEEYKKTEAEIRAMVKDSYGIEWESVKGAENKKIRFARVIFESRIEALKNCESCEGVLAFLKQNQEELTFAKVLNINSNQKGKAHHHKTEKTESESESALYGKPNPTPLAKAGESDLMACVAYLQTIGKNAHILAVLNTKLAKSGLHITYSNKIQKVA